ncbi:retrovirus-related pol polyprotein from transposon TNT 1-94 [Tanacetum coccineum]
MGLYSQVKHEAFGKFKEWKQLVKNQIGRTVKKSRTDNGLEFCNQEFEQLCIESGISRHLTVVETLQQNRLAERMYIILMDKVTIDKDENKTPMEMWSGHPGYPGGVKGYELYRLDNESPKIVTSKNVVFNESVMYKDTLKNSGASTDTPVDELHVEVELQGLNNRTLEEDQIYQEGSDDEDARDQETD